MFAGFWRSPPSQWCLQATIPGNLIQSVNIYYPSYFNGHLRNGSRFLCTVKCLWEFRSACILFCCWALGLYPVFNVFRTNVEFAERLALLVLLLWKGISLKFVNNESAFKRVSDRDGIRSKLLITFILRYGWSFGCLPWNRMVSHETLHLFDNGLLVLILSEHPCPRMSHGHLQSLFASSYGIISQAVRTVITDKLCIKSWLAIYFNGQYFLW